MADAKALELIQDEKIEDYNAYVETLEGGVDLSNSHLRGYDLRRCNLKNADLTGAYLRSSDLRGADLSLAKLEGASLKDAKVSGALFSHNISADELTMSIVHGTRIREGL